MTPLASNHQTLTLRSRRQMTLLQRFRSMHLMLDRSTHLHFHRNSQQAGHPNTARQLRYDSSMTFSSEVLQGLDPLFKRRMGVKEFMNRAKTAVVTYTTHRLLNPHVSGCGTRTVSDGRVIL